MSEKIDVREYHQIVEMSKMRKLMRYGQADFEEDWNLAIALTAYLANGQSHFQNMFDSCMMRVNAYVANNPDARPF